MRLLSKAALSVVAAGCASSPALAQDRRAVQGTPLEQACFGRSNPVDLMQLQLDRMRSADEKKVSDESQASQADQARQASRDRRAAAMNNIQKMLDILRGMDPAISR